MSEQADQKTTESRSIADMSSEELQAEIERIDQELAQEPPPHPSVASSAIQGRAPSTSSGETLAREVQALRRDLLRQYESLNGDEKYSDEHKATAAWQAYDKSKPLIEERLTRLEEAEDLATSEVSGASGAWG